MTKEFDRLKKITEDMDTHRIAFQMLTGEVRPYKIYYEDYELLAKLSREIEITEKAAELGCYFKNLRDHEKYNTPIKRFMGVELEVVVKVF